MYVEPTKEPMIRVNLNSIEKVKDFVSIINSCDVDLDLVHDRYVVDAKSIMGIFSLNISKPINLIIHTVDEKRINEIKTLLAAYIVE